MLAINALTKKEGHAHEHAHAHAIKDMAVSDDGNRVAIEIEGTDQEQENGDDGPVQVLSLEEGEVTPTKSLKALKDED